MPGIEEGYQGVGKKDKSVRVRCIFLKPWRPKLKKVLKDKKVK